MKVKKGQIFNLMDTNGRRNDVINALQGYLSILDEIQNVQRMEWGSMPESLAQFDFYRQAIALSPEVFEKHAPYDRLMGLLSENEDFYSAIESKNMEWIRKHVTQYAALLKKFDLGIEDRARHYTNNLVKLGFTDDNRKISPVGYSLLNLERLKKDDLESLFPIDGVNIIYMRQMMKLRLFDESGKRFCSPFILALYTLLKRERVSENEFLELVQGLNPYSDFSDIDSYILNYSEGDIVTDIEIHAPSEINTTDRVPKNVFQKYFKNRKSTSTVEIYWQYYNLLFDCKENLFQPQIDKLYDFYENNRSVLNKGFGKGKNIYPQKNGNRPTPDGFLKQNKIMFENNTNVFLFRQFTLSKTLDQIREYSDTTKRIFSATGIISFDNGFVELAYKELSARVFDVDTLKQRIAGNMSDELHTHFDSYEEGVDSYFCRVSSLTEILGLCEEELEETKNEIKQDFSGTSIEKISEIIADERRMEFAQFLEKTYPFEKVKNILALFGDRDNDKEIKEIVSPNATVPTIYEYIVGIAWYYFSGKRIDILRSYNLTLSANFEPLVHAGGGQGDIVIYEDDKVVMLEVTLMNTSNQKRGEWEPVLRHSVNLKIEEEQEKTGRKVTSFFISNSFDYNTINIWKAVAAVPLQSSVDRDRFTDNVVIMPISTEELTVLMDKFDRYDEIIEKVRKLFEVGKINFDINWREKFMSEIM